MNYRELANIVRGEIKDPRISPLTSVVAVEVAPDLKTCKVYVSVMGSDEDKENTMTGLNSAKGMIRSLLAKRLNMRNTPEITFILDESIEKGIEMMKFIDEVNAPLHEKERLEAEAEGEESEDEEV